MSGFECEDGNAENGDGCNSNCRVEQDYVCVIDEISSLSICGYQGNYTCSLLSQTKDPLSNRVIFQLEVQPPASILHRVNFTQIAKLSNAKAQVMASSFAAGKLSLTVGYNESLQFATATIAFEPITVSSASVSLSETIVIIAPGNSPAIYYDGAIYLSANICSIVAYVICCCMLFLLVLSLFWGNILAISLIGPFQLLYICFVTVGDIPHPTIAEIIKPIGLVVGYNRLFSDFPSILQERSLTSVFLSMLGIDSVFLSIFNYAYCVQLTLTTVSLVLLLLRKKGCRSSDKYTMRLNKVFGLVSRSAWLLAIFSLCELSFALGTHLAYGKGNSMIGNIVHIGFAAMGMALLGVNMLVADMSGHCSEPPVFSSTKYKQLYLLFVTILRTVAGASAGVLQYTGYSFVPIVFLQVSYFVYVCVVPMFVFRRDKVLMIVCEAISVAVTLWPVLQRYVIGNFEQNGLGVPCWVLLALLSASCCTGAFQISHLKKSM